MIARPEWDERVVINKLTGEPAKVDETTQWTPASVPVIQRRGGHWYLVFVAVIAVVGAWVFSALGLHPLLGATAIWCVVLVFAIIYHHVILAQVKKRKKELHDARILETAGGQGPGNVPPGTGDPAARDGTEGDVPPP